MRCIKLHSVQRGISKGSQEQSSTTTIEIHKKNIYTKNPSIITIYINRKSQEHVWNVGAVSWYSKQAICHKMKCSQLYVFRHFDAHLLNAIIERISSLFPQYLFLENCNALIFKDDHHLVWHHWTGRDWSWHSGVPTCLPVLPVLFPLYFSSQWSMIL